MNEKKKTNGNVVLYFGNNKNNDPALSNIDSNKPKYHSTDHKVSEDEIPKLNKSILDRPQDRNSPLPKITEEGVAALSEIKDRARLCQIDKEIFNIETPIQILYSVLFESLEQRVKSVPLSIKLVRDLQSLIDMHKDKSLLNNFEHQSYSQRTERLARKLSSYEDRSMDNDEYRVLLKALVCDLVPLDGLKSINKKQPRKYFEKASGDLSNASKIIRNYNGTSDELQKIKDAIEKKEDEEISGCYKEIRNSLKDTGIFDVLLACESVVHSQLNIKNVPSQLSGWVFRCGYDIPETALISGITAGKYLWPRYNPRGAFKKVEDKIKVLDHILNPEGNNERKKHTSLAGLGKIFTGGAIIASSIGLTIDALKASPTDLSHETASSLVLCTCMGINFIWLGLDYMCLVSDDKESA